MNEVLYPRSSPTAVAIKNHTKHPQRTKKIVLFLRKNTSIEAKSKIMSAILTGLNDGGIAADTIIDADTKIININSFPEIPSS
jgi:hypothetical protein